MKRSTLVSPLAKFNDKIREVVAPSKAAMIARESAESSEVRVDEGAEAKLERHRDQIIRYISKMKPRFEQHFGKMVIEGNKMRVVLASEDQERELRRAELEMLGYIVAMCGIDGAIAFEVDIEEEEISTRPVKLEDRIVHFAQLNPEIAHMSKVLGLQVEG